jgi:cytochrome c oxidase subunit 3
LRRARLGLAIALAPVMMLFLSFTVAYAIRQQWIFPDPGRKPFGSEFPAYLPWGLFAFNTLGLLLSSLAIERARRVVTRAAALAPVKAIPGIRLEDEKFLPWLSLAAMLGVLFLGGQLWAWHKLQAHGFLLAATTGVSFVYIITGMHAVHLLGGLGGMFYGMIGAWLGRIIEQQRIVVDVTAWFWHFLLGLWLYVLLLLWLAQ